MDNTKWGEIVPNNTGTVKALTQANGLPPSFTTLVGGDFSAPPALGDGTPAAVNATTLSASSTSTLADITSTTLVASTSAASPIHKQTGANGQVANILSATVVKSAMSGATVTATNLIPAGSVVLGVTVRVTTLITGATTFTIGDGTDVDRWGTSIAVTANTTTTGADFTISSVPIYAAATSVVLTATGSDFTAGAVRVTVHYISFTAATS